MSFFGSAAPTAKKSSIVSNLLAKINQQGQAGASSATGAANGNNTSSLSSPKGVDEAKTFTIKRRFLAENVKESFGLELNAENQIQSVKNDRLGAHAGLTPGLLILYVNGQFVETNEELYEACSRSIDVKLTCYESAAMDELIARYMDDPIDTELSHTSTLNFDELLRTTPRFQFLSMKHPLHLHWKSRLSRAKETKNLLFKVHSTIVEEQLKKEEESHLDALKCLEDLEQDLDFNPPSEEEQRRMAASAKLAPVLKLSPAPESTSAFFQNASSPSMYQNHADEAEVQYLKSLIGLPTGEPPKVEIPILSDADILAQVEKLGENESMAAYIDKSKGVTVEEEEITPEVPQEEEEIVPIPRTGPKPKPPPLGLTAERVAKMPPTDYVCCRCGEKGHWVKECKNKEKKRTTELNLPKAPLCNNFLRGRCTRGETCIFRHETASTGGRSKHTPEHRTETRPRDVEGRKRKRSQSPRESTGTSVRHDSKRHGGEEEGHHHHHRHHSEEESDRHHRHHREPKHEHHKHHEEERARYEHRRHHRREKEMEQRPPSRSPPLSWSRAERV